MEVMNGYCTTARIEVPICRPYHLFALHDLSLVYQPQPTLPCIMLHRSLPSAKKNTSFMNRCKSLLPCLAGSFTAA